MKVSFIIIVQNKRDSIEDTLRLVEAIPVEKEIVVVDDGSTDGTGKVLEKLNLQNQIHLICHVSPRGNAAALETALNHIHADLVFVASQIPCWEESQWKAMLLPFEERDVKAVYGYSSLDPYPVPNKILAYAMKFFFHTPVSCISSGVFMVRHEVLKESRLRGCNGTLHVELCALLGRYCTGVQGVSLSSRSTPPSPLKPLSFFSFLSMLLFLIKLKVAWWRRIKVRQCAK